jgi:DNA-binding NtrC family response regulator
MRMPTARVLVVDDHAPIRELLRRILEAAGYEVFTAEDAHSALAVMAAHEPHVAFLDVHMPGGADGLWLADQIRERFPTAATVLATADGSIQPVQNLRRGIIQYLVKPFQRGDVLRAAEDGVRWSEALRNMQH